MATSSWRKKRFARQDAIAIIGRAEAIITRLRGERQNAGQLAWFEEKVAVQAASHDCDALDAYDLLVLKAGADRAVDTHVRALLGLAFVQSWHNEANFVAMLGEDNKPIEEIERHLLPSVKDSLDELMWWAKATMAARAQQGQ